MASSAFNFSPYVAEALAVAVQRLFASPYDEVSARPLVASLANAIVEVQGPEFSPKSASFSICQYAAFTPTQCFPETGVGLNLNALNLESVPLELDSLVSFNQHTLLCLYYSELVLPGF